MKRETIIYTLLGLVSLTCSDKSELIFTASDELHTIKLYEKNNRFDLIYNGFNNATGIYELTNDTILLTYDENQFKEFDPNKKLTRKIVIDTELNRVKSLDNGM